MQHMVCVCVRACVCVCDQCHSLYLPVLMMRPNDVYKHKQNKVADISQ